MSSLPWTPVLLLSVSITAGASSAVRVWEASLMIPTYELGPANPNPPLLGSGGSRPIYPNPILDSLTHQRVE